MDCPWCDDFFIKDDSEAVKAFNGVICCCEECRNLFESELAADSIHNDQDSSDFHHNRSRPFDCQCEDYPCCGH